MVVIQKNETQFVSSRLHLPHCVGEEERININGVKWKLKNTAYLKFLYITDGVLLVRYRRNKWSQFVGVLIAKYFCARNPVSNCFTLKVTYKTCPQHTKLQYNTVLGLIVTLSWHYLIEKAFGRERKVSRWFILPFGDKGVNCNWVATHWQLYNTHLHGQCTERHKTNNTQNNTNILRTTQKFWKNAGHAPTCKLYPGICLTTEGKIRKTLSFVLHKDY